MAKNLKVAFIALIVVSILSTSGFVFLLLNNEGGGANKDSGGETINNQFSDDNIEALCLGNSITVHGTCSYWWGNWGMAASSRENDYAHILNASLGDPSTENVSAFNYSIWEMQSHDREETYAVIDSLLSPSLNLVVIQLGENVTDSLTFEADLESLIRHVHDSCNKAKIVVLGGFWDSELDESKRRACEATDATFVSLADLQGSEYQQSYGNTVYGEEGEEHRIEHAGVAKHPNNAAMREIAEKILRAYHAAID